MLREPSGGPRTGLFDRPDTPRARDGSRNLAVDPRVRIPDPHGKDGQAGMLFMLELKIQGENEENRLQL